jgi:adenylate cyclase
VTDPDVVAQWQAAGLYDPDADDADERRALLEHLTGLGLSVDDINEAACGRGFGQLAADRLLWGDRGPSLTTAELADRVGMTTEHLRRVVRAAGLADAGDAPAYRERHLELFGAFGLGAEMFGEEATLQFTRVLGSSAARAAEAAVSLFLASLSPTRQTSDASDLEVVQRSANAVTAFGGVPLALDLLLREHFIAAIRRLGLLDIAEGGTTVVAIAFVDLVDSTELARHVGATELSSALSSFENAALDAAVARDCRVVKLIGDEVMLVGATATTLLDVVNEVLFAIEDHSVLDVGRAGVAAGYAVSRDGDYFGPVVNLAARLVGAADAGEVLVDTGVANDAAAAGYVFEDAGNYTLKGFDEPVAVSRVRRARR